MKHLAIVLVMALSACGGKGEETPPTESGSATTASGSAPAKPAGSNAGSAVAAGSNAGSAAGSAAGSGSGSAAGSAVAAAPKDPDLPTAEDFEEDATARITEKNLEGEVKALEKEIGEN